MGRISARLADVTIVTSDNPRTEDPAAIVEEIHAGVVAEGREATATVLVDRREAVREALRRARPGDVVLLAGKGHETYQEIAGVKHPFDDREVVRELLVQMGVPR
jgi:UDP-N-acetylmuramoyl-L-alanyl-D-glutamate--2,6-diaminopimelate ligase